MPDQIQDGTGTGRLAKVTVNNHLEAHSFTEGFKEFALTNTNAFNINTGKITLTNGTATPVLYIENESEQTFVIPQIIYLLRASTGGSGDATIDIFKGITGGTIVSSPTNVDMRQSRNMGDDRVPDGKILKGATGDTRTGGTQVISTIAGASVKVLIEVGDIIIPPGRNICFEYTAPTDNTSQACMFIVEMWLRE